MGSLPKTIKLREVPNLESPSMVAAWPGIGNIGITCVNYLKDKLEAVEFGEVESPRFFFPRRVSIERGVLRDIEFPKNRFYYYKRGARDLIIFLGEVQPPGEEESYELANHVLDVGQYLGINRVYTAGAAVAPIHHSGQSRVWGVPNARKLIKETNRYGLVLMSDIEGRGGQGNITGLNGLLLGVAKRRRMEGICLLGEIPIYIANFQVPYPKAAKSILEVLMETLGLRINLTEMEAFAEQTEQEIDRLYASLPPEVREQLDKFKSMSPTRTAEVEQITEEDKDRILREVEEFFKGGQDKQT